MASDFLDAHERHWDDAEHLFGISRWANADHLYGMAAECGLKRLMIVFGMLVDSSSGSPMQRNDRMHADQIWTRYESYRSGHHQGASYGLPAANPFDDWTASQRYEPQHLFDGKRADSHRVGAKTVNDLIAQARRDGLL
jgi:hypothetical protein